MPSIPVQRAILTYRDRTERLIIESSLDAEGQQFGWIVPVPAKPTALERASPGLLKTLSLNIQPEIVHDVSKTVSLWQRVAVAVTAWALLLLLLNPRSGPGWVGMAAALAVACIMAVTPPVRLAGVTHRGIGGGVTGVRADPMQVIGSLRGHFAGGRFAGSAEPVA